MHNQTKIYFRADGGSKIGLGHVMRSLALAEILRDHFQIHFITRSPDEVLTAQIHQICHKVSVLRDGLSFESEAQYLNRDIIESNSILVLDGYQFDTEYQRILNKETIKLVCIDDIFSCHFLADAVINPGGGITKEMYDVEPYTRFFLGPEYVLLRKPFRFITENVDKEEAIFICLGGADPNNDVLKITEKLDALDTRQKLYIVIGAAYRYLETLKEELESTSLNYEILQNLSAEQMAAYMSKCPVAITSPSSVAYEYLSFGGLLYLYQTADNQKYMIRFLTKEGFALHWERLPENDQEKMKGMLEKQAHMFDKKEADRLYKIFRDLDHDLNCILRGAVERDVLLLYTWANDADTRAQSFNNAFIPLEDHRKWFLDKLKDKSCFYYILEFNDEPIGQIRFDIKNQKAVISYSIAKDFRGKGFGKLILEKGIERFRKEFDGLITIIGYVKNSNFASIKTFENLDFEKLETKDYDSSFLFRLEEKT